MPQPVSGAGHDSRPARTYAETDLDWLAARAGLPPARRLKMQAAADAVGFSVTSYVADELGCRVPTRQRAVRSALRPLWGRARRGTSNSWDLGTESLLVSGAVAAYDRVFEQSAVER